MNITWLNEENKELRSKAYCLNRAFQKFSSADFQVAPGFIIGKEVFQSFLQNNSLKEQIEHILSNKNTKRLQEISYEIRDIIYNAIFQKNVQEEIVEAYKHVGMTEEIRTAGGAAISLVSNRDNPSVLLIPNINGKEIIDKVWNVRGTDACIEAIRNIYASMFSQEALYYFKGNNLQHDISIIVQQMPLSDKSGVIYTQDPRDNKQNILVESNLGLPTIIEQASTKSDLYLVSKNSGELIQDWITPKDFFFTKDGLSGEIIKERVGDELRIKSTLNNSELSKIIQISLKLEETFQRPLKIEFSIEKGRIRITDIGTMTFPKVPEHEKISGKSIAKGIGASYGTASGIFKRIHTLSDLETITDPIIVFLSHSTKEIIPYLDKVKGIICESGNISSFLGQIAREKGIPYLINPDIPLEELDQSAIYLNAFEGDIFPFEERKIFNISPSSLITGTDIKLNGPHIHPEADGCVVLEKLPYEKISPLVEKALPNRVWLKKSTAEYIPYAQNVGLIYEPFEINSSIRRPFGIYLKDFASILQTEEYIGNIDHIILDLTLLLTEKSNNLKAVLNAVKRISEVKDGDLSILINEPNPELIEKLIFYGADSFIVPKEYFNAFRQTIAKKEKKLLLRKMCRI